MNKIILVKELRSFCWEVKFDLKDNITISIQNTSYSGLKKMRKTKKI